MTEQIQRHHSINRPTLAIQEWTALADLVRRGVTLGRPIFMTPDDLAKGSHLGCDFHLLDANGDEVDGGAASVLLDNLDAGYYDSRRLSIHRILDADSAERHEATTLPANLTGFEDGSAWRMTLVHRDADRIETFESLSAAVDEALRHEQTLRHGDSLPRAFGSFFHASGDAIQYGTDDHYVTFDRVKD